MLKPGLLPPPSSWLLDPNDRAAILNLDPDGEIIAVDIERDVGVLVMQMGPSRIVEPGDFPTSQDEPLNGPPIDRLPTRRLSLHFE
jgi:hypothetical protein